MASFTAGLIMRHHFLNNRKCLVQPELAMAAIISAVEIALQWLAGIIFFSILLYLGHHCMFVMLMCMFILPYYMTLWCRLCFPLFFKWFFFKNVSSLMHTTTSRVFLFISFSLCCKSFDSRYQFYFTFNIYLWNMHKT